MAIQVFAVKGLVIVEQRIVVSTQRVGVGKNSPLIQPPQRPVVQSPHSPTPPLAVNWLALLLEMKDWENKALRTGQTDFTPLLRTPQHVCVLLTYLHVLSPSSLKGPQFSVCTMQRAWTQRPSWRSLKKDRFLMNESPVFSKAGRSSLGRLRLQEPTTIQQHKKLVSGGVGNNFPC